MFHIYMSMSAAIYRVLDFATIDSDERRARFRQRLSVKNIAIVATAEYEVVEVGITTDIDMRVAYDACHVGCDIGRVGIGCRTVIRTLATSKHHTLDGAS